MRRILSCTLFGFLALASCQSAPKAPETAAEAAPAAPRAPQSALDAAATGKLAAVVDRYYSLKDVFVKSDSTAAEAKARDVQAALDAFQSASAATAPAAVRLHADSLRTALQATGFAPKTPLEQQRAAFERVSDHLTALLKAAGWKGGTYQQYCPMAFNDKGAHWLSNSDEIQNPYFGDRMLECGEVTDSL